MKRDNRVELLVVITIIIVSMIYFVEAIKIKEAVKLNKAKTEKFIKKPIKKIHGLTDKVLLDYIISLNIKFPKVVLAQAKLESGNYTSNVFVTKHNLFGMKIARQRPTLAKGSGNGYALYNNWKESVLDYAFMQASYYRHCSTQDAYLEALQRNYCENSSYIKHIKEFL